MNNEIATNPSVDPAMIPVAFTMADRKKLNEVHAAILQVTQFLEEFDPSSLLQVLGGGSPSASILSAFIK